MFQQTIVYFFQKYDGTGMFSGRNDRQIQINKEREVNKSIIVLHIIASINV